MGRGKWKLIGIDFHKRWREGYTRLDLVGDSIMSHHGWLSLEWARGPNIEAYRMFRRIHM